MTPADDEFSCVTKIRSIEKTGLKPCSKNTERVNYRKNPSDPLGDCVAVDANYIYARDDGFCIECKDNNYSHSDGRYYKVTHINEEN